MSASLWVVMGIALMAAEFVIPGFIIFFFGLGAVITGFIAWLFPTVSASLQLLSFMIFSIGALWAGRRFMPKAFGGHANISELPDESTENAGELATVLETVAPDRPGRVNFQGSVWKAEAEETISAGTQVRIVCRRNVVLKVESVK